MMIAMLVGCYVIIFVDGGARVCTRVWVSCTEGGRCSSLNANHPIPLLAGSFADRTWCGRATTQRRVAMSTLNSHIVWPLVLPFLRSGVALRIRRRRGIVMRVFFALYTRIPSCFAADVTFAGIGFVDTIGGNLGNGGIFGCCGLCSAMRRC